MLSMLMHSSSKEVFQAAAGTLAILSQQNGKGIQLSFLSNSPERFCFHIKEYLVCCCMNRVFPVIRILCSCV